MTNTRNEASVPEMQSSISSPNAAHSFATDASEQNAFQEFERASWWRDDRRSIGLGAAAMLAVGASAATAIIVRRRAQARVQRLEWLALRANAVRGSMPSARQAAPFGGAGGALLMTALLLARARRAQSNSRLDELHHRLAELESHLPSERARPRDLLIGAGVALGLAGLVARLARRPAETA
jgi:hypothetical protein